MITKSFAERFAKNWIDAWNSHEMDRILTLYSDDFIIESPKALDVVPESNGTVHGKENIKKYWLAAMEKAPGLSFELLDLFVGVNGVTIYHRNSATSKSAIEVMNFDDDKKVNRVFVYHSN